MMLILGQVRLRKGQESPGGLVPRRAKAPQGYSSPQGLEKIFSPMGAIPCECNSNGTKTNICMNLNLNDQGYINEIFYERNIKSFSNINNYHTVRNRIHIINFIPMSLLKESFMVARFKNKILFFSRLFLRLYYHL